MGGDAEVGTYAKHDAHGHDRQPESQRHEAEKKRLAHRHHLTSSLTKYVFYNWLINNILYLCVT